MLRAAEAEQVVLHGAAHATLHVLTVGNAAVVFAFVFAILVAAIVVVIAAAAAAAPAEQLTLIALKHKRDF